VTGSSIARDAPTRREGIIVATRFFAVGAVGPHIKTKTDVGAVATRAFVDPLYGPDGLALLETGRNAEATVGWLIAQDAGRDHRREGVVDRRGRFAAQTGTSCVEGCGHIIGPTLSVAGNMPAGAAVLGARMRASEAAGEVAFARRPIAAMRAGEAAGGDRRGKQWAALPIHDAEGDPVYHLRVDDHADPLAEMQRLQQVAQQRCVHMPRAMPTRQNPSGRVDRRGLEAPITRSIAEGSE
jgi:uncharacterized Ntn-hydrolase superfamily protein